jgi:hypothetical protein
MGTVRLTCVGIQGVENVDCQCNYSYNAKHTDWGSRLIIHKGLKLLKMIRRNNFKHLAKGIPTYWPSDRNKLPDLVDFCFAVAISRFDLSTDHFPVLTTLTATTKLKQKTYRVG